MSNEANEAELKVVDDFTVNAVHLVTQEGLSVDISNLCLNFRLYESIYSKFVTADITLLDSINLLIKLPNHWTRVYSYIISTWWIDRRVNRYPNYR